MRINEKYKKAYELCKQDIELGLYDKTLVSLAVQFGRISTLLELSDFTEDERDNEENKLRELCNCWEKRYYSKGGKNK